ncbi:hypothetical protein ACWIID_46145 [Streptomyces phaeochromogenes]
MRRIARTPSSEVVTTFGPNWFSRRENLTRKDEMAARGRLPGSTWAHRSCSGLASLRY